MKYSVSFANYPGSFRGCVVSPTKICLQFNDVQIKLRLHNENRDDYPKGVNNDRYVPVFTLGTDIDCTAVGCQMPVVEDYQMQLLDAYERYYRLHRKTYQETYKKEFKDFLLMVYAKLDHLLSVIEKQENV